MVTHPMVLRLAAYRLEQDLTFAALAAEITAAGYPLKERALHLVLTDRVRTVPTERTLYKITQFLETVVGRRPRTRARKRRAA